MNHRHFLSLLDITADELRALIQRAITLKTELRGGEPNHPSLAGKTLAMLFEKASTRTRVSFEVGMAQLGGQALFLSNRDMQLGRGEPVEDTARVLSRMVDVVMVRTHEHEKLVRFAEASTVPVINGLTDRFHPCQLLADIQTYVEHRGELSGRTVAFIGDGNNMCHSYINAARLLDFHLRLACPRDYGPDSELLKSASDRVEWVDSPLAAATGADLVVTDVWASMGQEEEKAARERAFQGYTVDESVMEAAKSDALFMHCLPAYREREVASSVIDGAQSVVWDEAENRLHAQKALLELLLTPPH